MAKLDNFNANEVEPMDDFEPIPAGKYLAVITDSEMKPTKKGTGSYLELTFEIIEGEYKGRKLWSRLNLENPSEQAVKIAYAQLSAICNAVEILHPQDSCDLHNFPLLVKVKLKRRDDTGELTNEISGYSHKESAGTPASSATSDTPPWKR